MTAVHRDHPAVAYNNTQWPGKEKLFCLGQTASCDLMAVGHRQTNVGRPRVMIQALTNVGLESFHVVFAAGCRGVTFGLSLLLSTLFFFKDFLFVLEGDLFSTPGRLPSAPPLSFCNCSNLFLASSAMKINTSCHMTDSAIHVNLAWGDYKDDF